MKYELLEFCRTCRTHKSEFKASMIPRSFHNSLEKREEQKCALKVAFEKNWKNFIIFQHSLSISLCFSFSLPLDQSVCKSYEDICTPDSVIFTRQNGSRRHMYYIVLVSLPDKAINQCRKSRVISCEFAVLPFSGRIIKTTLQLS